jgi:hypothetical protein
LETYPESPHRRKTGYGELKDNNSSMYLKEIKGLLKTRFGKFHRKKNDKLI